MSEDDIPKLGDLTDKPPEGPPPKRGDLTNIRPPPKKRPTLDAQARGRELKEFGAGVVQGGVFDPVEGIDQLIAHASDNKVGLPDHVRKWLEDYKQQYTGEGHTYGNVGRGVGTVATSVIPSTTAARSAGFLGRLGRGATAGGLGALTQPVEEKPGGDYAQQKSLQFLSGMAGGALSGPVAGTAAGWAAHELAKTIGWGPTLGLIGGLGLGQLARHHSLYGAARDIANRAGSPGAQFAGGRVGAAYGPGFMGQIFPDLNQPDTEAPNVN